jgi:hypothetical protein
MHALYSPGIVQDAPGRTQNRKGRNIARNRVRAAGRKCGRFGGKLKACVGASETKKTRKASPAGFCMHLPEQTRGEI